MRLCRFRSGDAIETGFYDETRILPIGAASSAYASAHGQTLDLAARAYPLDLVRDKSTALKSLSDWLAKADASLLQKIAVATESADLELPIAMPSKLLLLAGNYAKHVEERGYIAAERAETFPYVFWKPPTTTLISSGSPVVIPKVSPDHVDWECELGVVIGRACRNVSEVNALDHVAGYTVINDISDRKFTPNPGRKTRERDKFFDWLHGKWHDTFCPLGPTLLVADGVDPQDMHLTLKVNGETKQDATTAQMVFSVATIVSFISSFVTLEPGDVISTGTPSGVGSATGTYLKPGDVVEAWIEGIGTLRNPIVAG